LLGLERERQEEAQVPIAQGYRFAARHQAIAGILTNGLEHPVASRLQMLNDDQ